MIKVIVRNNVVENIGVPGPNDGPAPPGTTVYTFNGLCSVGWLWNNGTPVDPNPSPPAPPMPDPSSLDNWDRKLKALAIVVRPATGLTMAQFKAAIVAAYNSLG